ncbi:MAG: hypothetical protein N3C61_03125, partial [Candidatus Micrarchaeota archaeon]|nr:hypothetical protein [Candidatus Micrarchaeota archaeon]
MVGILLVLVASVITYGTVCNANDTTTFVNAMTNLSCSVVNLTGHISFPYLTHIIIDGNKDLVGNGFRLVFASISSSNNFNLYNLTIINGSILIQNLPPAGSSRARNIFLNNSHVLINNVFQTEMLNLTLINGSRIEFYNTSGLVANLNITDYNTTDPIISMRFPSSLSDQFILENFTIRNIVSTSGSGIFWIQDYTAGSMNNYNVTIRSFEIANVSTRILFFVRSQDINHQLRVNFLDGVVENTTVSDGGYYMYGYLFEVVISNVTFRNIQGKIINQPYASNSRITRFSLFNNKFIDVTTNQPEIIYIYIAQYLNVHYNEFIRSQGSNQIVWIDECIGGVPGNCNIKNNNFSSYSGRALYLTFGGMYEISSNSFITPYSSNLFGGGSSILFYNNFVVLPSPNPQLGAQVFLNTSVLPGPSIVGGPFISGNCWGSMSMTGPCFTCVDSNSDGFCDNPYTCLLY